MANLTPLLTSSWSRLRKLEGSDAVNEFSCGRAELDDWLHRFAFTNQQSGMTNVFVCEIDGQIGAYYALSTGEVTHNVAPARITKGVAKHSIPVVILTRFAVDVEHQGKGLGRAMLRDALFRVSAAAEVVGVRALLIHAKDADVKVFYLACGEFEESPTDTLHLFLLMKDLRKAISDSGSK